MLVDQVVRGQTIGNMAEWLRRQTRNLVGIALVGSNPAVVEFIFLSPVDIILPRGPRPCPKPQGFSFKRPPGSFDGRITQGSVQIVLIFRLLLKITVDWPFHAISQFL